MNIKHLTSENLIDTLQNEKRTILIDFYSNWCAPCKMIAPIMEQIANERQDIVVYKINTEEEPNLATQFSIMSIPTIIIIKNNEIQKTMIGVHSKQYIIDNI